MWIIEVHCLLANCHSCRHFPSTLSSPEIEFSVWSFPLVATNNARIHGAAYYLYMYIRRDRYTVYIIILYYKPIYPLYSDRAKKPRVAWYVILLI